MDKKEFVSKLSLELKKIEIDISEEKASMFYEYMEMLLEWNEKMNLTSIVEPDEIILKHFVDSLTVNKNIKLGAKVIDVGTGAGLPGIPLKVLRDDLEIILIDSLNKRITFLNEVIARLGLKGIKAVHTRAEDYASIQKQRESFDVSVSRAVANMSTLVEYIMPFVKIGGIGICMKGSNIKEELEDASMAIKVLGCALEKQEEFSLSDGDNKRSIISLKKIANTPKQFPRKQGKPAKEPIK